MFSFYLSSLPSKNSCPQCGQNFVLAQELGRHVRDKNCSFFNSTTSSSTTGAATEAASSMQPDMVVGTLASTSRTHPATTLTTTTTTTPAENSIIPNDSIKVNMNDHKVAKESHLYSSGSKIAPTTVASGAHRAGATSEHGIATLSRAAVDESEGMYGFLDKFFAYQSRWCLLSKRIGWWVNGSGMNTSMRRKFMKIYNFYTDIFGTLRLLIQRWRFLAKLICRIFIKAVGFILQCLHPLSDMRILTSTVKPQTQ